MSAPQTMDRARPPGPGPIRPFHFPPIHRRVLSSGMQLLVAEVHDFPVATLDVLLPGGAAVEDEARAGLASLTSNLLESGAGERDAADIAELVDGMGLSLDSGVTWDHVQVGFTGLRPRLEAGSALMADMVRRPTFPEAEVERLRTQRIAALRQSRADPASLASEFLAHSIYEPGVPFSRPMGGAEETVSALTRQDVTAFHAARYRPAGATLVAAGDVTVDEVQELAERHFGDWAGSPDPVPPPEPKLQPGGARVVVVDRPGAVQSALRVGHVGVERSTPDYFAIQVMNAILGGLFASRLNMNLRERLGYTYGASSGFIMRRASGLFVMQTAAATEVTAHAVSEMLREVREMQQGAPTAQEMDDARNYLAGVFPVQLQTTEGVAGKVVALATHGLPNDYWDSYRDRILAVTAAEVRDAAARRLRPEEAVVVVVGDAARLAPELEALALGPVSVTSAAETLR